MNQFQISPVQAEDDNFHTAMGMTEERAKELGQETIDELHNRENDGSIVKVLEKVTAKAQNVNELAYICVTLGRWIGMNSNPLAGLAQMLQGQGQG